MAETFLDGDGSAAAPSGTPQYADLLDGYAVRPSWQVAGVDYAVGAHPGVVLKVPTAGNLPPGTELSDGAIYVTGNNVTLSGYDLTGLTVMITDSATGTVTITDCVATSNVNIRSTVTATANLVVTYCTLDGGGMSSDPDFQLIKVWTPLTVEYCLIQNAPGAIYAGAPLTVMYNAMSGFAWVKGAHANAIYVVGGNDPSKSVTIAYNTIWDGPSQNAQGFPIGIGAGIAFFTDGGNYYNTTIANNTVISNLPGGASYLIGYYVFSNDSATGGVVSNNYVASINGFNNSGSGAFGAFYTGSTGTVQATYTNNIDMNTGMVINGSNTESGAPASPDTDNATLSIAALSADKAEGQSGSTPFTFTVTRGGDTSIATSASWAVTGSGASPATGSDFAGAALPSGTVSFAAGETSKTISVNVAGDTAVEPDQGFTVTLSNPAASTTIGTATASGMIRNDDSSQPSQASLSIAALSADKAEGQSGSTPFTFTVTRGGDTSIATSASWAVTGSGASPATGSDFVGAALPSGTVSFAAGETSKTISVNVAGDTAVEPDQGFTVTLSNPAASTTIGTATASGMIRNDDSSQPSQASLSIAALSADKAEGQSGSTPFTFTVTRGGDTSIATSASWAVTGSGASPATGSDFAGAALPSGTVSFAAGETSKTISVYVAGDTAVEPDQGFRVTLSNPAAGTTIGTATASGMIRNDDSSQPSQASLSIAALSADKAEGQSGSTPFTFTVTRGGDTSLATSASWAVTGSGANPAAGSDFVGGGLPSGTVSFAAGQTSKTITVNVAGDTVVEPDQGFTVTLSNPAASTTIGTASTSGTIRNDDASQSSQASLSIAALSADKAEGQSGSTPFTFTVTRGGDTSIATSASWAVTGSGANPAAGSDFVGGVLPSGTVSFAAGQTSQTITVNVAGDTVVEPDQGFRVTLLNPAAGTTIGTATASGMIRNDDASGDGTYLTHSLFSPGATPDTITENDPNAVDLGVKFQASTNGTIDGIRFYKGPQNTGVHTGDLWTTSGTLLASATFTNETASGWQQVNFSSPVSITAGTTYIASYETTVGEYSEDDNYFTNALTNGPLTALNSVYAYGSSNPFPNNNYRAANYWVDAVFSPSATQTPPALGNVAALGGFIASTFATPVGNTGTLALASSVSAQDQLAKPAG